jgi:hypothetical protein
MPSIQRRIPLPIVASCVDRQRVGKHKVPNRKSSAGEVDDKAVLDAALVAAAQTVEHYEICRYGTLIAWAEHLGHGDVVRFLTTTRRRRRTQSSTRWRCVRASTPRPRLRDGRIYPAHRLETTSSSTTPPSRNMCARLCLPRRTELLKLHHGRNPADHWRLFRRLKISRTASTAAEVLAE